MSTIGRVSTFGGLNSLYPFSTAWVGDGDGLGFGDGVEVGVGEGVGFEVGVAAGVGDELGFSLSSSFWPSAFSEKSVALHAVNPIAANADNAYLR